MELEVRPEVLKVVIVWQFYNRNIVEMRKKKLLEKICQMRNHVKRKRGATTPVKIY